MALLVAAGLFTKSLVNISRVDLGLNPDNVVMFRVAPVLNGYKPERSRQFFQDLEEALAALPGVIVGQRFDGAAPVRIEQQQQRARRRLPGRSGHGHQLADSTASGPDYFRTLGIPLLAGREFTRADGNGRRRSPSSTKRS